MNDSKIQQLVMDNITRIAVDRGPTATEAWIDEIDDPNLRLRCERILQQADRNEWDVKHKFVEELASS